MSKSDPSRGALTRAEHLETIVRMHGGDESVE